MPCPMAKKVRRSGCRATPEHARRAVSIQCRHAALQGDRAVTSSSSVVTRRWTVIAAGLLVLALALVVIYTGQNAFLSPIALVVVAAIGLAALLLQVRFRQDLPGVRSTLWLNIVGLLRSEERRVGKE